VKPPRPFEQPWESRAFGAALALRESGALDYEEFRAALIERIQGGEPGSYYEHWQAALERVLAERGVVAPEELAARVESHRSTHEH
jgi:nitrile hydratase accessory protein